MATNNTQSNRVRKTVNDLVMAEMFLFQATIESATVIGDGITQLIAANDSEQEEPSDSLSDVLQRIKDDALEPYTSRYQYFKEMISS